MTHSFSNTTDGQRRPSLAGGPAREAVPAEPDTDPGPSRVRVLASGAPQAQPLIIAQAQAGARRDDAKASSDGGDPDPSGLRARLDAQMLFEDGIRSGQALMHSGASRTAIDALVTRRVQAALDTDGNDDALPCWISGLVHGLGGPEIGQGHVQAVLAALMRDGGLASHVQQGCLHAVALALSGKNLNARVRVEYTPQGVQEQEDLSVPHGSDEGSARRVSLSAARSAKHGPASPPREPTPRPAWDTRLPSLLGGQVSLDDDQVQAWNRGMQGLHLAPLWRMDTRPQPPTLHGPSRSPVAEASSGAHSLRRVAPRPVPAARAASTRDQTVTPSPAAAPEDKPPGAPSRQVAIPAEMPDDEANRPGSPDGGDAMPQTASPSGGDAMPADPPQAHPLVTAQAGQTASQAIPSRARTRELALALSATLQTVPDLMTASANELEACLQDTWNALPAAARRELEEDLRKVHLGGISATDHLRQLHAQVLAWQDDLAELESLVKSMGDEEAEFGPSFTAVRQRLLARAQFVRRLLEDTRASLVIEGHTFKAVAEHPSLSVWLSGWIEQAYARIPRAAWVQRLIERAWPTLPPTPPDALQPLPRPARVDDEGSQLERWFEAEIQRRWAIEDAAIDPAAARILVAGARPPGPGAERSEAFDEPREREVQALLLHHAHRETLGQIRRQFRTQLAQLTDDRAQLHAIAIGLTAPPGRMQPDDLAGDAAGDAAGRAAGDPIKGAGLREPTFEDLAEMMDLLRAHSDPRADIPPPASALAPALALTLTPVSPARTPPPAVPAWPSAADDSDASSVSEDPDPPDDMGVFGDSD